MGPSVNLAARLMCSKSNSGILIDEKVQQRFIRSSTKSWSRICDMQELQPVKAKGYDKPVKIFSVVARKVRRRTKISAGFGANNSAPKRIGMNRLDRYVYQNSSVTV